MSRSPYKEGDATRAFRHWGWGPLLIPQVQYAIAVTTNVLADYEDILAFMRAGEIDFVFFESGIEPVIGFKNEDDAVLMLMKYGGKLLDNEMLIATR